MISGNGITVVFLEGPLILSNVYEKVKILKNNGTRKHTGNVNNPFGLKRIFSRINVADKFLT